MEHHLALLVIVLATLAFEVWAQITFDAPPSGTAYLTNGVSTTSPVSFMSGMAVSGTIQFPAPAVSGSLMFISNLGAVGMISNDSVDSGGKITASAFVGDGSRLTSISATYPQNISTTNITISNTLNFTNTTLPTCSAATVGMRQSGAKACWCNGTNGWINMAPSTVVSILGSGLALFDTCP